MNARSEAAQHRVPPLIVAAIALSALLAIGAALALPRTSSGSIWKGYSTLLVDRGVDESEVLGRLTAAGARGVLSESTEPVVISDWARLEATTLAAAQSRLLPNDPRRDAYIDRLSQWFSARVQDKEYRVYYLPARFHLRAGSGLASAFHGLEGRYFFPDSSSSPDPHDRWIAFAILTAILLTLCFAGSVTGGAMPRGSFGRARFSLRVALLAPWLVAGAFGSAPATLAALWGAALVDSGGALLLPLLEFRRSGDLRSAGRSLAMRGRPPLSLLLVGLGSLLLFPSYWLAVLLALFSSLTAVASLALVLSAGRSEDRVRFVPLPLGSMRQRGDRLAAAAAIAAIVLWTLTRLLSPPQLASVAADTLLPVPVSIAGPLHPAPQEARERIGAEGDGAIPGLADWLAHRAYEEALPLLVLGERRDDPFAAVKLPRPQGDATVLSFGDAWARTAYRSIPPASVEGLLSAQVRAVQAQLRAAPSERGRPLAPIEVILYIILLIPPLRRIIAVIPAPRSAVRPAVRESRTRELRQEA